MSDPVLVTGATGFLGGAVLRELERRRLPALGTSRRAGRGFVFLDLAHPEGWNGLPTRVSGVIHAAAHVPQREDDAEPDISDAVNARGTLALLDRFRGVPWVLLSSGTIETDGRSYFARLDRLSHRNFYETSKFGSELYAAAYAARWGCPLTVLRCSYLYGAGMRASTVVRRLVDQAAQGGPLVLREAGARVFDFLEVRDAARAAALALAARPPGPYFIGSGEGTSVLQLARTIQRLLDRHVEIELQGQAPQEQSARPRDLRPVRQALGWEPRIPLADGLRELLAGSGGAAR